MNTHPEITYKLGLPPEHFDGFGFFKDAVDGTIKFTFFDDFVKEFGPIEKDAALPVDRESYHVVLTNVRKTIVHLDAPFTSTFTDAFTYAANIAHSGFSGVMIRQSRFSAKLLKDTMDHLFRLFAMGKGFVYHDETGVETFHQGKLT